MRRLTSILMILVLTLAGYNYYQIGQMRQELRTMRSKVQTAEKNLKINNADDLLVVLEKAKSHSTQAKELLAKGKTRRAKAELDESLKLIEKATKLSQNSGIYDTGRIIKALERIRREVGKAWIDFASESKKQEAK